MDVVCKVKSGGSLLQTLGFSGRGEYVYLLGEQACMELVQKLQSVNVRAFKNFPYHIEPIVHISLRVGNLSPLVVPVGGHSLLRNGVHSHGSYLNLNPASLRVHKGAVQSLVSV